MPVIVLKTSFSVHAYRSLGVKYRMMSTIRFSFAYSQRESAAEREEAQPPLARTSFAKIDNCFITLKEVNAPASGWAASAS
jgi:hypothetical protein